MNKAPFLNWFENFCLWILWRSPRTGLVAVKQLYTPIYWIAKVQDDPDYMGLDDRVEPPAHHLERIYHLPAYGEVE